MGKKIVKEIKEIIAAILNIIYPPEDKCIICDAEEFVGICPLCKSKIKKIGCQEEILSYGFYGGILKELILSFKYKKNFTAGNVLAELLLELIKEEKIDIEVICYVPMSKKSIKKRGFNQCEILAKKIGNELNIPVSNCLVKKRYTKEQKTLSRNERLENVKSAFEVPKIDQIYNKKILLIDDVVTTGATLSECRYILEKVNPEKITILTIAKSRI